MEAEQGSDRTRLDLDATAWRAFVRAVTLRQSTPRRGWAGFV